MAALLAACTALALSGCFDKKVDFSIDNPTDAPLSVRIDDKSYEVQARSAQDISLPAGRHSIDSAAIGKRDFIVYAETRGGLINPSLNPYVTVNEVYAVSDAAATGFSPFKKTITIDGVVFKGPFSLTDGLFIDKTWTYGVHENFPESITTYDRNSKGNIKSKLFAKEAFLAYFETNSEQPGYYAKNKSATPAPRPNPLPAPVVLPVFLDAETEAVALKLKTLYTDYARADKADEQLRLRKSLHGLTLEFVQVQGRKASKAPVQENEKYNALVQLMGNAFGESARVVP